MHTHAHAHLARQVKLSGSVWRNVSPAAKDCIRAMLTPDALQRPSAAELLGHPWLAASAPATAISSSIVHQLQVFAGLSRARRVMLGVAAKALTGAEASRLVKAFLAVDKDYNGTLEFHELAVAAKQVRERKHTHTHAAGAQQRACVPCALVRCACTQAAAAAPRARCRRSPA